MSKLESTLVGLFVGIACPLLTFVVFWWSAALMHMHISGFPLRMVIAAALLGLGVGLLLDVLFLRKWVQRFYVANPWLIGIVYLCLCIAAVAFFMGLPIGTLALGIAVGVYAGRKERHVRGNRTSVVPTLRKTALMAASVTTMAALPIGILALNEQDILAMLATLSGLSQADLRGYAGFALVGLLCVLLFLIQYWFSKKAGLLAFNLGQKGVRTI